VIRGLTARVAAQAKINLRLKILAREASGYHSLETIFQRIDLTDAVRVRVPSDGRGAERTLDCAGPRMPADGLGPVEKNLAYRAAVAYADATGWPNGFAIEIEKCIPVGGGLGGGSADAGAVLRALDGLSPRPLGPRLLELAAPLGADVPFLTGDSVLSLAWGHGERMLALPALESRHVLIVVPPFAVKTADAYRWADEKRGAFSFSAWTTEARQLTSWSSIAAVAENDFEEVLLEREPTIGEIVAGLRAAGAEIAMLSGSGSSVFGVMPPEAENARHSLRFSGTKPLENPPVLLVKTARSVSPVELTD